MEKSSHSSELPSEITLAEIMGNERSVPGSSSLKSDFRTPTIHVTEPEPRREQERMTESRVQARLSGPDFSTYTVESESDSKIASSSSEGQFQTMLPDSQQHLDTFSTALTTFSEDESSLSKDEAFKRLLPVKPKSGIKTYAVTMDGDLVSEHSDSDRSPRSSRWNKVAEDLTSYSLSSVEESTQGPGVIREGHGFGTSDFSSTSKDTLKSQQLSDYSYKSSSAANLSETSEDSHPKSSSLTNVTSDPSLSMTGASNLSQYTFKSEDITGAPNLTQYTLKSEDMTDAPDLSQYSLKSTDKSHNAEDKTANAKDEGSNYLEQKFASLDNLISESKSLIAKHKVLVDKNKQMEEEPKVASKEESVKKPDRGTTPGVQSLTTQESNVKSR